MKLFVEKDYEGMCIEISSLSVHESLTFVTVPNTGGTRNALLKSIQAGLVNSFEVRNNEIKVAFFTKYVREIR